MRSDVELSRGGHVGQGGIQAWSAGDLFPWTIYTVEHYVPLTRVVQGREVSTGMEGKSLAERFLYAEIIMRHPNGHEHVVHVFYRGEDSLEGHRIAQRKAEHCIRVWRTMDEMARILHYGRPELTTEQVASQVVEHAREALATCRRQAPAAVAAREALFRNEGGYEECMEVDYYGGGTSAPVASPWGCT